MTKTFYDCIVVGAGPAGLSASLFLARYLHRTLTFHHNNPRNEYAHGVHGFLGHHNISPAELLERGRNEVTLHGGSIVEGCVTEVELISNDHFRVSVDLQGRAETYNARRLLLATGLKDLTPDCPGFREFYGASVHHCPDCDGYESRNKRIAVLGSGARTVGFALSLLTWTNRITLITNGGPGDMTIADRSKLSNFDIHVLDRSIAALEGDFETKHLRRVLFTDGESLECDSLFFNLGTVLANNFHEMVGCKLDEESGLIWVDQTQQTSVGGVYAAGDVTPYSQLAIVAAAEGAKAAIHLHHSLMPAERRV